MSIIKMSQCVGCGRIHESDFEAISCCQPLIVYACEKCGKWAYHQNGIVDCCKEEKGKKTHERS
jgi:hypothetical protein